MSGAAARRRAERRGAWGEIAAAALLMLKGYQIVARRRRTGFGEIDLIARRGGVLAFVEVKTLASAAARADPVRPRQMARTAHHQFRLLQCASGRLGHAGPAVEADAHHRQPRRLDLIGVDAAH